MLLTKKELLQKNTGDIYAETKAENLIQQLQWAMLRGETKAIESIGPAYYSGSPELSQGLAKAERVINKLKSLGYYAYISWLREMDYSNTHNNPLAIIISLEPLEIPSIWATLREAKSCKSWFKHYFL